MSLKFNRDFNSHTQVLYKFTCKNPSNHFASARLVPLNVLNINRDMLYIVMRKLGENKALNVKHKLYPLCLSCPTFNTWAAKIDHEHFLLPIQTCQNKQEAIILELQKHP